MSLINVLIAITWIYFSKPVDAKFYSTAIANDRLMRDLFVNYDPISRPAPKGHRIDVNVSIELQHFEFHEPDGVFKLHGILYANWFDPKLGWNPKDYNNITMIPLQSSAQVWVPDLEFYNNAPDKFLNMQNAHKIRVKHNGNVLWSNSVVVTVFCTTNMRDWPHDRHVCKLSLGSWTYDGLEIDITNTNASMNFEDMDKKNMEYRIIDFHAEHVAVTYECCVESYITVDYHITFERRSAFVVLFRAPALCVILLTLLTLNMEAWRGEKIWINGVSLIIVVFNLLYFASNIARFARRIPLIVIFYSCCLVMVTFAQLIAVFSLFATRSLIRNRLSWRISRLLQCSLIKYIAPPVKMPEQSQHEPDPVELNTHFEDVRLQEYSNLIGCNVGTQGNEWVQLAMVIERISVILYAVLFLILSTTCFV